MNRTQERLRSISRGWPLLTAPKPRAPSALALKLREISLNEPLTRRPGLR